jgi:molybdenum cofactor synthesis domain-containing protein
MIEISKAFKIIKRETKPLGGEIVPLEESIDRILAEDIFADSDMPPFDRSQMDGYAMKAADTTSAPVDLKLVGESAAGRGWHGLLKAGEAVRIMTGARVPQGADAIQKIELTNESGDVVTIEEATIKGKYIVRKGAEIKKGKRLFRPGELIDERTIASLAAFGYANVHVATAPRVSILGTGSEIVTVDKQPAEDQIRNSNSVMLKAMCERVGAIAKVLPQTGDDLTKLKNVISKAVGISSEKSQIPNPKSQILVITGGVSVGKYDLTKAALSELGAEIYFQKVRLRPGKPAVFARLNDTLIFGLPGNPVSAAVTFYLFVRNAILLMQSASDTNLRSGFAVLTSDAKAAKERDTYLPASLESDASGRLLASPLRWHGSSDFVGFARANVLVSLKRGEIIPAGGIAPILFL